MSFALALFAASTAPLAPPPRIMLEDRTIRAGDLARVPGREDVILGLVPAGKTSVTVDAESARRLLRKRLPFANFSLRFADGVVLEAPAALRPARACYEAGTDIPSGAPVTAEDVSAIACSDEPVTSALGYDRQRRAPVARGSLRAGAYLGAMRPFTTDVVVGRGTRMTFRTGAGPVVIERQVEALQTGRTGSRIFARTNDGEVIAAPVLDMSETAE